MFDDCHTPHVPPAAPQPTPLSHALFQPLVPVHEACAACADVSQCPDVLVSITQISVPLAYDSWYSTQPIGAPPGVAVTPVTVGSVPPMSLGMFTVGVVIDIVGATVLKVKYPAYCGAPGVPAKFPAPS